MNCGNNFKRPNKYVTPEEEEKKGKLKIFEEIIF